MTELLSGGNPLRGRARLDLMLRPFNYRQSTAYYDIRDPDVAFRLNAFVGGTAGYRDLLGGASPQNHDELDRLVAGTLLNPSHALFGEASYLLREDPRITDRALYRSVLAAIGAGSTSTARIGAVIGRSERGLTHALDVLTSAGLVVHEDDVLLQRRPALRLADPVIRFHDLVTRPRLAAFEDRLVAPAWEDAQPAVDAGILGPHFESLAREWVRRFAAVETTGGPVGEVGATVVNDSAGRSQIEVDVVALARGQRRQSKQARVLVLGEAKASGTPRGMGDLARLERTRALLVARDVDAAQARLLLFGRSGFAPDVLAAAASRQDVDLVDIDRLWFGE